MHVLIIAKHGKSISYGNPNFRNKYIAQGPDSAQPTDIFEGVLWVDSPGVQYPSMDNVFHGFDFCCFSKIDKANAFDEESNGFTVKMQWSPAGKLDSSQAKIVYDIIDSYKQTPRYKSASGQHNYYQGIYEMSTADFLEICGSQDADGAGEKERKAPEPEERKSPCITIEKGVPFSVKLQFSPESMKGKTLKVTINVTEEDE